jgi:predicted nucleic acid-binding protein
MLENVPNSSKIFIDSKFMKANGILDIATNDSDFEQVDWITVWKPSWVRS